MGIALLMLGGKKKKKQKILSSNVLVKTLCVSG